MSHAVSPLLVVVLLLNLLVLGTSRLRAVINAAAWQGVVLGLLTLLVHPEIHVQTIAVAAGAILVKGIVIPFMLMHAMRDAAIRREVEPFIGFIPSLFLGAIGTGLA